ncbi:phage tail sheath family protein [Chitinophaga rhizophila]|uniref:Phage tail sheath subtilisin-like domain-containing protein n=1 Tax=Chitinophaga rhizophila TaxID=2866212 RepID=A0ABS7GHK8_9BACT|nr:phage tail sheath C-terminal domain-containing protein [Chitinophaga rhizophila]MBW8686806.1 phage tail sheath subtilisin-like domain-containing protein [Chitinophaga rhizophila]
MASTLMTPGVYIEEKNAFPSSAVAVETAVPVFIGYTHKAERFGKSLLHKPTRVTSFAEFVELFGAGFRSKFSIADPAAEYKGETFIINGVQKAVEIKEKNTFYLYNSIRLFYANGGSNCYIVSVGTYGDKPDGLEISLDDFTGSDTKPDVLLLLEKEFEPTLVVIPDVIALGEAAYNTVYTKVLAHCAKTQSRFGIFDLAQQGPTDTTDAVVAAFRDKIGINALNYGAAYYPWLKTAIVQANEVDFENLDATVDLETLLPEDLAKQVVKAYKAVAEPDTNAKKNYHQSLKASSPVYNSILEEIRARLNELPPGGAIAGIYTLVDNSRGVWKSPANVSISMVNAPAVNISADEQKQLNVDVLAGKSINVIRPFPGVGTLIWGGRTLDGNSQDWRYINVRRTLIMIEQSIKLAARTYVFEPNDATTWVTVKAMIDNFLNNLWKQGALAGAAPEQAYDVQLGLGATMTPQDILDGKMLITVKVAIVRPAEFIVITFQQMMQQS